MSIRSRLAAVIVAWLSFAALGAGFVSSNDGSHVALARALALRGETRIDPDVGLTLGVDRARRDGHDYSDRPPGTAFAALPAVWLGHALDGPLARRSEATGELVVQPGSWPYLQTYAGRSPEGPPLYRRQGTAVAIRLHAALLGALGLWVLGSLAVSHGLGSAGLFVTMAMALATLWGPYSTALFSHVTAGTCLAACVLLMQRGGTSPPSRWVLALAGLCGAWAVASDYALAAAVVPLTLLLVKPRSWGWIGLGVLPIALATGAYHDAAFGSPLSIGYDHSTNFAFARARASTFDGNPLEGLWTLWGMGRGAGVLALSPVLLPGLVGLWRLDRRLVLGLSPWMLLLCFHHTPWGGSSEDHRYLVPAVPLLVLGLGHLWVELERRPRWRVALALLGTASAVLSWGHFLAWRAQT